MKQLLYILSLFYASSAFGQNTTIQVKKSEELVVSINGQIKSNEGLKRNSVNTKTRLQVIGNDKVNITSFQIWIVTKDGKVITLRKKGAFFTEDIIKHIKEGKIGSYINIDLIKGELNGNDINLNPLSFILL